MNESIPRRHLLAIVGAALASRGSSPTLGAAAYRPPITTIAFSPDGTAMLAGSQSGVSIRNGDASRNLATEMDNVNGMRFLPDGKSFLLAGGDPAETGVLERYSWPQATRLNRREMHDDVLYSIDISPDGSRYVLASGDEVCSVHSLADEAPLSRFTKHSRAVLAAKFLPDSRTVVSASRDQTLRVWNSDSGNNIRTLHNHSRDVRALATKPTVEGLPMVASASADLTIRFWQPTIGRMVRFVRLESEALCIAWLAGGERLVAGCRDGKVRLIDPLDVVVIKTIDVSPGWVHCVAVDPVNDRRAVFGTVDGQTQAIEI